MDVIFITLLIGLIIFFGCICSRFYVLTSIPDILILLIFGLCIGPVLGLILPSSLGVVGPVLTSITLTVILFEGGLYLKVETIRSSIRGTVFLTTMSFMATVLFIAGVTVFLHLLDPLPALMIGAILGGTASAFVIPVVENISIQKDSRTILVLESALNDIFCVVALYFFIDIYYIVDINIPHQASIMAVSFIAAVFMGIAGGMTWSVFYPRLGCMKNVFLTPAFLIIISSISEIFRCNGLITALVFGITLGNLDFFKITRIIPSMKNLLQVEITPIEKVFLAQFVSLLKTFFFIYIGISIVLGKTDLLMLGIILVILLCILRLCIVMLFVPRTVPVYDASIMAVMIPKGLIAAGLAAIPYKMGITGSQFIEEFTYEIVLISIVTCSFLIVLLEKTPLKRIYAGLLFFFGKP